MLKDKASYHVTARSNYKKLLLEPAAVKKMFLDVVARAKEIYSFRLENYVLMGNHFHFIIHPTNGSNLSMIMKWIMQTFAIRYNKANGLIGHFWGDRFFSYIIPNYQEYLRVFFYIDNNPVKAELVSTPWDWKWCALWLRRTIKPDWLDDIPLWVRSVLPLPPLLTTNN